MRSQSIRLEVHQPEMSSSGPENKDSVTQVAEESFVRERPLEIERGAVLAGRYQVEEIVGKGGSGVVLRVFDRTVQNVVALKILKSELARDSKWDKRFSRELRLGRPIQHPNVCRIFDIGEADGHRFLTMELAAGGSLRDELKARPALDRPLPDRLADARAAIEGLASIHAAGVVHRDFKPDNLLRMDDGRLVISDFGLATDAATGPGVTVMIGTPHYMAPEVLAGEPATARSDVWALGVVLHEILFGRRPERRTVSFDGGTRGPVRPATPIERGALWLMERCLAEAPADRPADGQEVSALFRRVVESGGRRRFRARRLAPWLALAAVALTTTMAVTAWRRHSGHRAAMVAPSTALPASQPVGEPNDWSNLTRVLTKVPGRVHCFTLLDDRTARLIWGVPRQASDVDLDSGQSRSADLVPDSYRSSCPDLSRATGRLIYSARNAAGATEVRLSNRRDGADAAVVTSGRDPRWLAGESAFVYVIDDAHTAVFSLATMQFNLLSAEIAGRPLQIGDVAVSATGNSLAVTGYDNKAEGWVQTFLRQDESPAGHFPVPLGSRIAFGERENELLLTGPTSTGELAVARLDVGSGRFQLVGHVPGQEITRVVAPPERLALVARQISTDVWSYQHGKRERLTSSADVYSAALSPSGDLLLGRRALDRTFRIYLHSQRGSDVQLTEGPSDVSPAAAPKGSTWAYANYAESSIRLCDADRTCRVLIRDRELPGSPTFSPDGRRLSFLTQTGRSQMKIVTTEGQIVATWDALRVCGGIWSTGETVWSVENVQGVYYWVEHNARTGETSGRRNRFADSNGNDSGVFDCRAEGATPGSPLFRPIQVEVDELSEIRIGPRTRLVPD